MKILFLTLVQGLGFSKPSYMKLVTLKRWLAVFIGKVPGGGFVFFPVYSTLQFRLFQATAECWDGNGFLRSAIPMQYRSLPVSYTLVS